MASQSPAGLSDALSIYHDQPFYFFLMDNLKIDNVNAWGLTPEQVAKQHENALIDYKKKTIIAMERYNIDSRLFKEFGKMDKWLQLWFEDVTNGAIYRDEKDGNVYGRIRGHNRLDGKPFVHKFKIEDKEKEIVELITRSIQACDPLNKLFVQDDCRGSSLWIYQERYLTSPEKIDCIYSTQALSCVDPSVNDEQITEVTESFEEED